MHTRLRALADENEALRATVQALRCIVDSTNGATRARVLSMQSIAEQTMQELRDTIGILRARLELATSPVLPTVAAGTVQDRPRRTLASTLASDGGCVAHAGGAAMPAAVARAPADTPELCGRERGELRATIVALRCRLAERERYWERTVQLLALSHREQIAALEATAAALRASLAGSDAE